MTTTRPTPQQTRLVAALDADDPSIRLQAALRAGSDPDPAMLGSLVERCAVEPDFFVRDMLSWALTRLPRDVTLPRIREELRSSRPRARSQALHTLSKIGDPGGWAWIGHDLLADADDDVARTAWRVAVALAPDDEKRNLVDQLVAQLGRGDRDVQLSLSRALVDLGAVIEPALRRASTARDPRVAAHARATELLRQDPEADFDAAVFEARRLVALGPAAAAVAASDGAARADR
jgi:hypothetical protein